MRISVIRTLAACVLLGFVSGAASHGLIQDPPSRNWFCGAITKLGLQFQVGRPPSFNDFADLPVRSLTYSDANPTYTQTYTIQGVARTQIVTF